MEIEYENIGVQFTIISEEMIPATLDFIEEHYEPDDPVGRSLGMVRNGFTDAFFWKDAIMDRSCLAALDKDGKILAVRMAKVSHRSDWGMWYFDKLFRMLLPMLTCCCRKSMTKYAMLYKVTDMVGYDPLKVFSEQSCDTIYEARLICSARSHGIKGLGTELVKRGEQLAIERGCTHSPVLVTGNYSANIFRKLGYSVVNELEYDKFRDEDGELYLKDVREHIKCIYFIKKLQ